MVASTHRGICRILYLDRDREPEVIIRDEFPNPYDPQTVLSLLFYFFATGAVTPCKMKGATFYSVPGRFVAANQRPGHDTIFTFRRR